MGDMSYQGGIGGFVFACPRGSVKLKLYGTSEQFPSILFQILQEIESEGYVTRELYVDTHSVNLSKAAEEVAAMYRVRIIPVSAGTPARDGIRRVGCSCNWTNGEDFNVRGAPFTGFLLGTSGSICRLYSQPVATSKDKDKPIRRQDGQNTRP